MRAFLALDIVEKEVISNITRMQVTITGTGADLKLVDPSQLHFTLKFFGEIPEGQAEEVFDRLTDIKLPSISVQLRGLGAFPDISRISVIWIGVEKETSTLLLKLSDLVEQRLAQYRFSDERRFSPHLTIARVKSGRNKDKLQQLIRDYGSYVFGTDTFFELKLKSSVLTPKGPIYTDVHVHEFGGRSEKP